MLTKQQMLNAKFARGVENDPNFEGDKAKAIFAYEFANSDGSKKARKTIANRAKRDYLQGVRVLNGHTMRQTSFRPAGTDPLPTEIEGSDQTLTIDDPHGSYTLCFRKRH